MTNIKIGGGGNGGGLAHIKKKLLQGRGVLFGIHKIAIACTVLSTGQIDHTILISEGYSWVQ